jgi:UDP-glucose 4-epimerase
MRRLKIAVTGTRGVIGGELVRRLEGEESCRRLVLLDLVPPVQTLRKGRFYRVDLTEPAASLRIAEALERERPDVIVHLAFLQQPIRNPRYEHELESLGTMHVLHALTRLARHGETPHLVLGGSTLVYGAHADNPAFLSEDAPLRGRRDYALVGEKIDSERQLERLHEREGFAVTVLRTAPLLSPGVRSLLGRYLSLPALPTILGFNPMIQALGADDAVEGFWRAIQRGAAIGGRGPRSVFNVCAAGVLPLHTAIRLSGRRSVPLLRFAANAMVEPLFQAGLAIAPSAHLDYLQYSCVVAGELARAELDFTPRHSTRDCVARFARTRLRDAA